MRGINDDELADLVEFAVAHGAEMRFIEQMPLDAGHTWDRAAMVTREEILTALAARWSLTRCPAGTAHRPNAGCSTTGRRRSG